MQSWDRKKKICVVTATRAEYGLLYPLISLLNEDKNFQLQLIVTGTHLSPEFGYTVAEIEKDKFEISKKIEILLSSDSPVGVGKSMGLAHISFSEVFNELKPELILLLGDRTEILPIASSALVARIPVAHLHGGEITEGAYDDSIRHCITKLSHLHFVSTEEHKKRVIQLGEEPSRVFNVGAIGIDNIINFSFLSREELKDSLDFDFGENFLLVTYHPTTLSERASDEEFSELLKALDILKEKRKDIKIIFTRPNSDVSGRLISERMDRYISQNESYAKAFESLGQLKYLSAMRWSAAVVGNSSSGIIEAPSLKIPTVNIGDRQKGRTRAESIIDCPVVAEKIYLSIEKALSDEFKQNVKEIINPYGDGSTAKKIHKVLKDSDLDKIAQKRFYDL